MKLIEPVATNAVASPANATETWGVKAVGAPLSPFSGEGITVAVLDTGINPTHPAFASNDLTLERENFTTDGPDDQNGHGTHCAGTIFGRDVNGLRIGVAPGVKRALIGKVLGSQGGSSLAIARAINWAVSRGAHVISMSLGIDFPGYVRDLVEQDGIPLQPATSLALQEYRANVNLFAELAEFVQATSPFTGRGSIIVAASGNESARPQFRIAVAPPAASGEIVAVGALAEGPNGLHVASFSNTEVDIAAPGVNVISAALGGGLVAFDGTSMATPHVAGVAALWAEKLLEQNGQVGVDALAAELLASGARGPLEPNAHLEDVGGGIVQAPAA